MTRFENRCSPTNKERELAKKFLRMTEAECRRVVAHCIERYPTLITFPKPRAITWDNGVRRFACGCGDKWLVRFDYLSNGLSSNCLSCGRQSRNITHTFPSAYSWPPEEKKEKEVEK